MELRAEVYTRKQLSCVLQTPEISLIYAPYTLVDSSLLKYSERIVLIPPVYLADCEEDVCEKFKQLKDIGFKNALVHTIGNIEQFKKLDYTLYGGHRLNCANSESLLFFNECGINDIVVSPELTAYQIEKLDKSCKIGFLAYGHIPLMITRRCPISNGRTCDKANCGRILTDRMNNELHVICNQNTAEILNSDVLYLADKMGHFSTADFAVLKFTYETDVNSIIKSFLNNEPPCIKKFTRGLYFKGVKN